MAHALHIPGDLVRRVRRVAPAMLIILLSGGFTACAAKSTLAGRAIEGQASIAVLVGPEDPRLEIAGVEGVSVELRSKAGLIGKATSDPDGQFKMTYNPDALPSDPVEIIAKRDGYAPARTTIYPPKPGQAAFVQLKRVGPVPPAGSKPETAGGRTP